MVDGGWVEGGCLCGAVRYRVEGQPLHAGYCHCRMCQRAAGAPVVAWGAWPADRFAWLQGKPGRFASSAKGERSFCPSCGTSLTSVDPGDRRLVEVTLASLDDPAAFPPEEHIWTASRIRWLELGDKLPRHTGPPGSEGESGGP
jgi:hypothetical protein